MGSPFFWLKNGLYDHRCPSPLRLGTYSPSYSNCVCKSKKTGRSRWANFRCESWNLYPFMTSRISSRSGSPVCSYVKSVFEGLSPSPRRETKPSLLFFIFTSESLDGLLFPDVNLEPLDHDNDWDSPELEVCPDETSSWVLPVPWHTPRSLCFSLFCPMLEFLECQMISGSEYSSSNIVVHWPLFT